MILTTQHLDLVFVILLPDYGEPQIIAHDIH